MLVTTRYQNAATISSGTGSNVRAAISREVMPNMSSVNGTAVTSEVVFSMLMTSLPVGGMITRIAWGSTVRRIVMPHDIPGAVDASDWPSGTELIPARMISAM